jgi:ribonuclease HI
VGKRLTIYSDGCSKGNPGRASIGVIIYQDNDRKPIFILSDEIGVTTNNQAEYKALIRALEYAVDFEATEVKANSDSELIVNQMNGRYRVKKAELKPLYEEAKRLSGLIKKFSIRSIPREQNREADILANKALDGCQ